MKMKSRLAAVLLAGSMVVSAATAAWAADEPEDGAQMMPEHAAMAETQAITDAQAMTELKVLQGEGDGVTDDYLAKPTTRIQAAILFLRLNGLEETALSYTGTDSFADADLVGGGNQAILAYLKAHPELGWAGTGDGMFDPLARVTAQQYYKVLLEALGYKQDADFAYDDTIAFAAERGLYQLAAEGELTNRQIATATMEALRAELKDGSGTLAASLAARSIIDSGKADLADYERIRIATDDELGSYLTDEKGMTLYLFTKDSAGMSACMDQCAVNWPIYYAEHLVVPAPLDPADFSAIVREDGKMQTTYKDMPLYYFIKDTKAGDVTGQGVNGVWFVVPPSGPASGESDGDPEGEPSGSDEPSGEEPQDAAGKTYEMDIVNFAYAQPEMTIEAGSSITFTNRDAVKHNVVSDALVDGKPLFETPLLDKDESFTLTFDTPGEYTYYCAPHKDFMKGKIIVK